MFSENIQQYKLPDFDERIKPVSSEKMVIIWEIIINKQNFWQFRLIKISKRRKKLCVLNHLAQKENSWWRPWRKKSWQLLWGKLSLNIRKNQIIIHSLASLAHQVSVAENQVWKSEFKLLFASMKGSIDTLTDEIQPVVLEKKGLDSQGKVWFLLVLATSICMFSNVGNFPLKKSYWMMF